MPTQSCSDEEFITAIKDLGINGAAKQLNINRRAVYARRRRIEGKTGQPVESPWLQGGIHRHQEDYPSRAFLELKDGIVLVGSDAHIWPGPQSTATRAFIRFCKDLKPKAVVLNGDVLDFGRISRHPSIGWEDKPTVQDEIEAAQDTLNEIEQACGRGTQKFWPLGNHDSRFSTFIANLAPEFAKVSGVSLSDHFPLWRCCWGVFINEDVVVKHRFKGGIHAPHNNSLWSGTTMVTGHLHSQKIIPFTDYRGTRYGVDTGCLAEVHAPAFVDYTESSPLNWRSGFCVLTFVRGILLPPELVTVWDKNHIVFRGSLVRV